MRSRKFRRGFHRFFRFDKFDADHQSEPAHVADAVVFFIQFAQAVLQIFADDAAFSVKPFSSSSIVFKADAMQTGLPPKVEACAPLCQSIMSARATQAPIGKPEPMPLARHIISGFDAVMIRWRTFFRFAHSRLHFVNDQHNAVFVADAANFFQKSGGAGT
jgi:hypothetical protein